MFKRVTNDKTSGDQFHLFEAAHQIIPFFFFENTNKGRRKIKCEIKYESLTCTWGNICLMHWMESWIERENPSKTLNISCDTFISERRMLGKCKSINLANLWSIFGQKICFRKTTTHNSQRRCVFGSINLFHSQNNKINHVKQTKNHFEQIF